MMYSRVWQVRWRERWRCFLCGGLRWFRENLRFRLYGSSWRFGFENVELPLFGGPRFRNWVVLYSKRFWPPVTRVCDRVWRWWWPLECCRRCEFWVLCFGDINRIVSKPCWWGSHWSDASGPRVCHHCCLMLFPRWRWSFQDSECWQTTDWLDPFISRWWRFHCRWTEQKGSISFEYGRRCFRSWQRWRDIGREDGVWFGVSLLWCTHSPLYLTHLALCLGGAEACCD